MFLYFSVYLKNITWSGGKKIKPYTFDLHRKEYKANCFFNAIERNYSNRQKIYTNITNAVLDETNK